MKLDINAAGNPLSETMARYVTAKIAKEDVKVFLHPVQMQKLCCAVLGMVDVVEVTDTTEVMLKPLPHTFCGLEVVQDTHMRSDEVHWRDKDGKIVARLKGLAD